ncbi:MAG: hypothetical protein Q9227_008155 [Pyrenula ochraceoflavens]
MSSPDQDPSLPSPPQHILILGAGVFGLSAALSLSKHPLFNSSRITLVDQFAPSSRSSSTSTTSTPTPNPSASSIDSSRIIRADYADPLYASLALQAQRHWRSKSPDSCGGQGRYHEPGFLLTVDNDQTNESYVRESLENVQKLAQTVEGKDVGVGPIEEAHSVAEIDALMGSKGITTGQWGYLNKGSGWADAGAVVKWALGRIDQSRVDILQGRVEKLLYSTPSSNSENPRVTGAQITTSSTSASTQNLTADLTILSLGAWSPSLLPSLRHRATATGHILGYISLTPSETQLLKDMPILMNLSQGLFVLPPDKDGVLKVARHGFGYRNPKKLRIPTPDGKHDEKEEEEEEEVELSIPEPDIPVPPEGQHALRSFLHSLFPPSSHPSLHSIATRPFLRTRVCWYTDTPTGDFIIDFHPHLGDAESKKGLLVATGGSGHAWKMFPVLGGKFEMPVSPSNFFAAQGAEEKTRRGLTTEKEAEEESISTKGHIIAQDENEKG